MRIRRRSGKSSANSTIHNYSQKQLDDIVKIIEKLQQQNNHKQDEVTRLQNLVTELTPYLVNDVRNGLWIGPPDQGHEDDCADCIWYTESLKWRERIVSGELGFITPDLVHEITNIPPENKP